MVSQRNPEHARSSLFTLLNKCNYGDDIEEDEMDWAWERLGIDVELVWIPERKRAVGKIWR